jgi:hypothetical protein
LFHWLVITDSDARPSGTLTGSVILLADIIVIGLRRDRRRPDPPPPAGPATRSHGAEKARINPVELQA